ncbi:hypothetical protein CYLTODRAFT_82414 [Cylindrobasidium torrendii FP15055 ss-10]|uniref:Uncharacterized protein n=1 Tax=Cylindrobasidium torrendii FP15055 ss-10 TaxID=1314674 RepID=A0A0D7B3V0_9AGAR|nr:hypothetical protein CYLTODRAFT_82414 [Cylindrobasidium torrendii FP15055 ss-10]
MIIIGGALPEGTHLSIHRSTIIFRKRYRPEKRLSKGNTARQVVLQVSLELDYCVSFLLSVEPSSVYLGRVGGFI